MFEQRRSRMIDLAVVLSAAIHVGLILAFSNARSGSADRLDLHEVTFMDVTYRPEVARLLPKIAAPSGGSDALSPDAPTYAAAIAPPEAAAIDLSTSMERDRSQAKIDLDGYELDRGSNLDVIRLGGEGSGKSTDEILSQPKVSLARGFDRSGTAGASGLRGYPGVSVPEAQLRIEHRPLAKAPTAELPKLSTQELPQVAAAPTSGSNFMVAGPISQRAIAKRIRPRYPKWALDRRISGTVVVKIWVTPDGLVKGSPTVESSSGYPDLDQVVVSALRGWEFAPLGPGVKAEDQWGIITFRFTLS
jgi:TonB family protein